MDLFLSLAFQEQSKEDGLTVMCRGCGVQKLMTKFIQFYCYGSETHHQSQVEEDERKLVFVINVKDEEQGGGRHKQSDEQTIMDTLLAEGVPPNRLPTLLTSKTKMEGRREEVFGRGGCFICTSRILIVDLLDGKVDAKRISGILVPDAHEIAEGGVEAFIIRKYRESNQSGFVKAFSDQPEEFTGDFGKIERTLKALWLKRLYVWPRFRNEITGSLDVEPEVIQLAQPMSAKMKNIQHAVLVAMDMTIKELQKAVPYLDTSQMVLENGLFKSFFGVIHAQLQLQWHSLSSRTKALVYDLKDLRKLLFLLTTQDAVSFYYHLMGMKEQLSDESYQGHLWMSTAASDTIFDNARARLFTVENTDPNLAAWAQATIQAAAQDTNAIGGRSASRTAVGDGRVASVLSHGDGPRRQNVCAPAAVDMAIGTGGISEEVLLRLELLRKHRLNLGKTVQRVMEPLPKWTLMDSVLAEIKEELRTTPSSPLRVMDNRILILVKDYDCLVRLKEALMYGRNAYQDSRYRWFLTHEATRIRRKHKNDAVTAKAKARAAARSKASKASMDASGRPDSAMGGVVDVDAEEKEIQPTTVAMMMAASARNNIGPGTGASLLSIPLSSILGTGEEQRQYERSASAGINISPAELVLKQLFEMEPAHLQRCNEEAKLLLLEELCYKNTPTPLPQAVAAAAGERASTSGIGSESHIGGGTRRKRRVGDARDIDDGEGEEEGEEEGERKGEGEGDIGGADRQADPSSLFRKKYKKTGNGKAGVDLVFNPTGRQAEPGEGSRLDPHLQYVFMTHAELFRSHNALADINPAAVVLYDPVPDVARMLECHQVECKRNALKRRERLFRSPTHRRQSPPPLSQSDYRVKCYFLMYDGSAEEHHYTASLAKERRAFESLIVSKGKMAICLPDLQADLDKIRAENSMTVSVDTRTVKRGALEPDKQRILVVDTREFRRGNFLPHSLDRKSGLRVLPRNISVGDYHLSHDLCVERKAIADLIESLRSGRLYSQCEGMLRYFQHPIVLIEFSPEQAFAFPQHGANNTQDFRKDSVQAMLTILMLRFANVRLLWSRSHVHTANLFERLVKNSGHPVDITRVEGMGAADEATFDADASGDSRESRDAALAMLNAVPGVNGGNVYKVMESVESLAALAQLTIEELRPVLGSPENARACFNFFNQR